MDLIFCTIFKFLNPQLVKLDHEITQGNHTSFAYITLKLNIGQNTQT